jgi:glycosyltransferase involved in cell wall biosynthesis
VRIAFKPADREGVGSYRILFPMRELVDQFGWECESFVATTEDLPDGRTVRYYQLEPLPLDADVIVLQREMNLASLAHIARWQSEGRRVVLDLDDDHSRLSPSNPAWAGSHPDPRIRAAHYGVPLSEKLEAFTHMVNRDNLVEIARAVDAITVTTDALAATYGRYNRNVLRLSNALDWPMWERVVPQYGIRRERLRIGYMGISDWHQDDLRQLVGVLEPWLRSHPDVDFVAAGDEKVHELLGVPEGQRVSYERRPFGEHVELTATMDIGVVPLAENGFNESKSALKGLEKNACGIAVVASPTQPYREYAAQGGGVLLARRGHDWVRHLNALVEDAELRVALGKRGRAMASAMTIQRAAKFWQQAYGQIVGARQR